MVDEGRQVSKLIKRQQKNSSMTEEWSREIKSEIEKIDDKIAQKCRRKKGDFIFFAVRINFGGRALRPTLIHAIRRKI